MVTTSSTPRMITGYNTDVRHDDIEFHVQTEDKGTANPFIESLIYVGGQVLAAKRTSYADMLTEGKGHKAIVGMMDQQHRGMIAAIRSGKFDEKVRALLSRSRTATQTTEEVQERKEAATASGSPSPPPPSLGLRGAGPEIRPPDAKSDRTLDEVILEYLTTEAQQDHLVLTLDEEVELAFGRRTAMIVRTSSSRSKLPVVGAEITVKMISTVNEPQVLGLGSTDDGGCVEFDLEIPELAQGTAALIITASSSIGKAELKYLL